jgi:hypothetical protein
VNQRDDEPDVYGGELLVVMFVGLGLHAAAGGGEQAGQCRALPLKDVSNKDACTQSLYEWMSCACCLFKCPLMCR